MFDFVKNIFKDSKKVEMRPELKEIKKQFDQHIIPKSAEVSLNKIFNYEEEMANLVFVLQRHFRKVREDQMSIDKDEYADKEADIKKGHSETIKKYNEALQAEIDIAMKAHDQQNVLVVLGRIQNKFNEVAGNGRKD